MYWKGEQAKEVLELLKNDAERTYDNYETCWMRDLMAQLLMKIKKGLARELARMNLTSKYLYPVVLENWFIKFNEFFKIKSR